MKRIAVFGLLVIIVASCSKLSGENDYTLVEGCKDIKHYIEHDLVKVDPERGIHYVHVDTTTCQLKIRYEAEKADLSWVYEILDSLEYLRVLEIDTIDIDSTSLESHIPDVPAPPVPVLKEVEVDSLVQSQDTTSVDTTQTVTW